MSSPARALPVRHPQIPWRSARVSRMTPSRIGTISLVSGAFAYIGQPAYDGLRACIERFNAQGGVQGRKLEIVAYDDQYDAATGKAIVERMVEQDQVFALVGLGGNIVETSLDYLKEKGDPCDQHLIWSG